MPKPPPPTITRRDVVAPSGPGTALQGARLLPLDLIDPNPLQARQVFNEAGLAELAASIRERGVLEPILVRPGSDGRYQLVAGERRTRAARLADLDAIPALIRELDDIAAALATAAENDQREDLDVEDRARFYQHLMELTSFSGRELARHLGKAPNYVNRLVSLLRHPDLLAHLRAGAITQEAAFAAVADRNRLGEQVQPLGGSAEAVHDVPLREEDSRVVHDVPLRNGDSRIGTERSSLDPTSPAPAFRWRPWQQFATALERTPPTSVPPDERATLRAQIEALETKLAAWKRALAEE